MPCSTPTGGCSWVHVDPSEDSGQGQICVNLIWDRVGVNAVPHFEPSTPSSPLGWGGLFRHQKYGRCLQDLDTWKQGNSTRCRCCPTPPIDLRYVHPAHPNPLIKGMLLDLLRKLASIVAEAAGRPNSISLFSLASLVLRTKLLLSWKFWRVSGSCWFEDMLLSWYRESVRRDAKGGRGERSGRNPSMSRGTHLLSPRVPNTCGHKPGQDWPETS